MKRILAILILVTIIIGCGASKNKSEDSLEIVHNTPVTQKVDKDLRKVIKEADLSFRINSKHETYSLINRSLKGFGAYISDEKMYNYSDRTGIDMTIKVPSDKFDDFVNFVVTNVNIKVLDNKSTKIEDVTEEYIDIQARIKIKKEAEQKLVELLKQAKDLSETLDIQKQLTDLRSDIESIEGRLKFLSDQVAFSTVRISFYENIKYSDRFLSDFWDSLKDGWQVFLHLITLLANLWVIILVLSIFLWGYKYYKRRILVRRKKSSN